MRTPRLALAGAAVLAAGLSCCVPADAASYPSISPSVRTAQVKIGTPAQACPSGVLCTVVANPDGKTRTEFFLANCHTYAVSYWKGAGSYFDNQTGGVTTYFYDKNHQVLTHFRPNGLGEGYYWDKVYYIKNC